MFPFLNSPTAASRGLGGFPFREATPTCVLIPTKELFKRPLSIDLNDVKTRDNSRIRELETSGKLGSIKEDIPLQTVRFSPGYR